jgi:hypothetical protein
MSDLLSFEFWLRNTRTDSVQVALEPWGETRVLEPGVSMKVNVSGPLSDDPGQRMTIQLDGEDRISVWGWTASTITVE